MVNHATFNLIFWLTIFAVLFFSAMACGIMATSRRPERCPDGQTRRYSAPLHALIGLLLGPVGILLSAVYIGVCYPGGTSRNISRSGAAPPSGWQSTPPRRDARARR